MIHQVVSLPIRNGDLNHSYFSYVAVCQRESRINGDNTYSLWGFGNRLSDSHWALHTDKQLEGHIDLVFKEKNMDNGNQLTCAVWHFSRPEAVCKYLIF